MSKMKSKFPDIEYQKLSKFESAIYDNAAVGKLLHHILYSIRVLCLVTSVLIIFVGLNEVYKLYHSAHSCQNHHYVNQLVCTTEENNRFDCWPEKTGATQESCNKRGCCWQPSTHPDTAPYCFFPSNYNGYNATQVKETETGLEATLMRNTSSFYSPDVKVLKLKVDFQTDSRLRIKIFDPSNHRYEVPLAVPSSSSKASSPQYKVSINKNPFSISVTRKSTGEIIFDTNSTAPLIFSDQFLQIATKLSTSHIYGLGEHRNNFHIDLSKWGRYVFWNRDDIPKFQNNGYGSHPFFLNLERGRDSNTNGMQNNSHGVFLLNSNAGEVAFQPNGKNQGAITYRFLGGILDFFVLMGPEPSAITPQLADVIGHPYFPPFWSLGYHLCRWGYNSSSNMFKVIKRNRDANMPYDVQWNDIDYMDSYKDWTYDSNRFKGLPGIVTDLHNNQQHYIIMADPAISSSSPPGSYPPFDDGKQMDVFIKDSTGQILNGKVWPGETAFPDFFHPNAEEYWYKQAKGFHDKIPFDGLWIDMNEPSNFVTGSVKGCPSSKYNNPPYVPATVDSGSLTVKTVCLTAQQHISIHYNLHNMYGWSQANVSRRVLNRLYNGKRSPMITRSSFPGSGVNTGHWLGDNYASFSDMYFSIPGILNFNLFGLPQVGVDICGFRGATTNELCTRWTQLGAFYPFMRNHADLQSPDQDPASFPSPYKDHMRSALELRYTLLAVLYTAFYQAHVNGLPIIRPLMFYYSGTELIDRQFMWGDQLLISPVLDQGKISVTAYLPDDRWYDFYNGTRMPRVGQRVELDAPLDRINVHIKGGSILPLLPATQRTSLSRKENFEVTCAPDAKGNAAGRLFWDDGESLDSITKKHYTELEFSMSNSNSFASRVIVSGYRPPEGFRLGKLIVLDVQNKPNHVMINGRTANFAYDESTKRLILINLNEDMTRPIQAEWH